MEPHTMLPAYLTSFLNGVKSRLDSCTGSGSNEKWFFTLSFCLLQKPIELTGNDTANIIRRDGPAVICADSKDASGALDRIMRKLRSESNELVFGSEALGLDVRELIVASGHHCIQVANRSARCHYSVTVLREADLGSHVLQRCALHDREHRRNLVRGHCSVASSCDELSRDANFFGTRVKHVHEAGMPCSNRMFQDLVHIIKDGVKAFGVFLKLHIECCPQFTGIHPLNNFLLSLGVNVLFQIFHKLLVGLVHKGLSHFPGSSMRGEVITTAYGLHGCF
mmetsp:Transcript_22762/g.57974  ORF Transcript_22762/g.57974 Transcript_22762/m.57974 type:complete len:280 (+) Transcript_22762:915-1754(+)